ncbi:MAG: SAM-dependent DNA methyltransferase, partial [Phycisphaerales bacterium JB058]
EEMRLAPEARELVNRCAELSGHADDDGIVCLTPLRGEASAADRLRALLRDAFGDDWTSTTETRLLKAAGDEFDKGKVCKSLDEWLREKFFEHHCKLFHHRPFVWHIWDGRKDGFSALVNYHKLAGPEGVAKRTLETLTYSYLREWILRQEQGVKDGAEGADGRLAAAQKLKDELEKIIKGEPPYDLFVRWKPLHEQPIGWEPDINDGVRLNIRPFLYAEDVGKKGAGVLRWKPNVKWTKDRGKEPQSLRPREQFPWFWKWDEKTEDFAGGAEFDGARWNDLHYTIAAKQAARAEAEGEE